MKLRYKPSRFEIIAFLTGLDLMAFELVAARILAPTIGSSTYIWTNVIGVIIASLSIGYYLGGKIADVRKRPSDIAFLLLLVALMVTFVIFYSKGFTELATSLSSDARTQGLIAAIILFAPVSLVLGMVSPYLAKLAVVSLKTSGQRIAGLSTWNAIGSIVGTFGTGFVLFDVIGSRQTLTVITVILLLASWLLCEKGILKFQLSLSLLIAALVALSLVPIKSDNISIDTAMANYQVSYSSTPECDVVNITSGPGGTQSGTCTDGRNDLLFWYNQQMADVVDAAPANNRILVLGGGAFTMPAYLAEKYPDSTIDVVEIDPGLGAIAKQYFNYEQSKNTNIFFEDARSFVNRNHNAYDIILVDAYSDAEIPWQLLTHEYGARVKQLTNKNSAVIINAIASEIGVCSELFHTIIAPYHEQFLDGWFVSRVPGDTYRHNLVLVFSDIELELDGFMRLPQINQPAYTDNYAPIDAIYGRCLYGT